MTRLERLAQKKNKFFKIYSSYVLVLIILLAILFFYVRGLMIQYERNSPENHICWLLEEVSENSELGKYLEEKNFSDNRYGDGEKRKTDFYAAAENASFELKAIQGNYDSAHPAFDVLIEGKPFATIALNEISRSTKLGIMTMSEWEIAYAILRNGSDSKLELSDTYSINARIVIPEDFTLEINGEKAKLEPAAAVPIEEFAIVAKSVEVPKAFEYEINDVYYEPVFKAYNNGGEEINFIFEDDKFVVKAEYAASKEAEAFIMKNLNPLEIGESWSKFMTKDLEGDLNGFYSAVSHCRLLYGTDPYYSALRWAKSIDISFVSKHTLLGFSNEKLSNFVKYNDKLYSCDVYFEKNMLVNGNKTDVFNNRLFFISAWGTWYMVDMLAL